MVIPSRVTPIRISRSVSSSVSTSARGSQSSPSAGMQYWQRRLQRSVSDTRRSVATRPYASPSGRIEAAPAAGAAGRIRGTGSRVVTVEV